jgi:hypothetical protein
MRPPRVVTRLASVALVASPAAQLLMRLGLANGAAPVAREQRSSLYQKQTRMTFPQRYGGQAK